MTNTYLESNTGFYDTGTESAMNFLQDLAQIIHGRNRIGGNTGYTNVYFTVAPDVNAPPEGTQLALAYGGLKPNVKFTIEISLWANLPDLVEAQADFYVAYSTPGMPKAVFFPNPFPVKQNGGLIIPVEKPTADGIYYFWIWGVFPDAALWYEIFSVSVKY